MSWAEAIDQMNSARALRQTQGLVDDYRELADVAIAKALEMRDKRDAVQALGLQMMDMAKKLEARNKYLEEMIDAMIEQGGRSKSLLENAEERIRELERTNAMNYAEKKVFMQYGRDVRNASDITPVFDPILYAGSQGNWIRERIREVAGRVYDVGGSIQDGARAAVREMHAHVPFMPMSPERHEQIDDERWETVVRVLKPSPDANPTELLNNCPDINIP